MLVGYIRVSTQEQNTIRQEVLLESLGVEILFIDKASGKNAERPELIRMMEFVRVGDTILPAVQSCFQTGAAVLADGICQAADGRYD